MKHYLAFDGGGSKLDAVVFDEELRILSRCGGGGVNGNFYSEELITSAIESSAAAALRMAGLERADGGFGMLAGNRAFALARLGELCGGNIELLPEFYGCQLSAALTPRGCVVISGTGSGVALVCGAGNIAHIGGYGAVLGDEGSGYYIGQEGLRAAVRALEGWGEPSVLAELLAGYAGSRVRIEIVRFFHGGEAPLHLRVADFARCVGKAAESGDPAATDILERAGRLLALQTLRLFEREHGDSGLDISLCGGAWKCSPLLRASFERTLRKGGLSNRIMTPLLEPVAGGMLHYLLREGRFERSRDELLTGLAALRMEK